MERLPSRLLLVVAGLLVVSVAFAGCTAAGGDGELQEVGGEQVEQSDDDQEAAGEHESEGEEHEGEEHGEAGEEHEGEGEEHMEGAHAHSPEDHMAGNHDVPDEAAEVPNPLAGDENATALGAELYAENCALCHGETGEGDGPGGSGLEPPPADLHEAHVQGLTDGALFFIISHGKPDTPMPAWENLLTAVQRWQVVNFLRTFEGN